MNRETGKSFSTEHDRKANLAWKIIRDLSDELCRENGLSVIQIPEKGKGKSHYEWEQNKAGNSWKAQLKTNIDECIMSANSFDDFLWKMQERGYRIKRGKFISFQAKGQERFTHSKTLDWFYQEEQLRTRIDRRIEFRLRQEQREIQVPYQTIRRGERIISIEGKVAENEGLKRWAMLQNMKNATKLINEMTEQGYTDTKQVENRMVDLYDTQLDITREIKHTESEISERKLALKKVKTYLELKPINAEYKSAKNKENFYREHEDELLLFDAAKSEVKPLLTESGKLPATASLEKEIAELEKKKAELMSSYKSIKAEISEVRKLRKQLENLAQNELNKNKNDDLQ